MISEISTNQSTTKTRCPGQTPSSNQDPRANMNSACKVPKLSLYSLFQRNNSFKNQLPLHSHPLSII